MSLYIVHSSVPRTDTCVSDSKKLNGERVFNNVKKYTRNGSIIVFHDSLKGEKNLRHALPKSIEWLKEQGYDFKLL